MSLLLCTIIFYHIFFYLSSHFYMIYRYCIAEQNSSAAYRLSRLYLLGTEQMPADKEKGLAYLQLAASHDHKAAKHLLDRLAHPPQNRPKPRRRHYVQRGNVAPNLQMLLRSISSDMEQAHRAAMREFEQHEWLNEQRGRLC